MRCARAAPVEQRNQSGKTPPAFADHLESQGRTLIRGIEDCHSMTTDRSGRPLARERAAKAWNGWDGKRLKYRLYERLAPVSTLIEMTRHGPHRLANQTSGAALIADDPAPATGHQHFTRGRAADGYRSRTGDHAYLPGKAKGERHQLGVIDHRERYIGASGQG